MLPDGVVCQGKDLVLVGTVHGDPDGPARLRQILRKEAPSVIGVEISPYGLSFRQRNGRRLRRILRRRAGRIAAAQGIPWQGWGQIQAVFAQLSMPFEYKASLCFCRESGGALFCLDVSSLSRHLIGEQWGELLSRENIRSLAGEPAEDLRESVKKVYALASRLLSEQGKDQGSPFEKDLARDPEWQAREAALARRLTERFSIMECGRMAYVGGWQHLLKTTRAGTLYDRIGYLHPRRVLLA